MEFCAVWFKHVVPIRRRLPVARTHHQIKPNIPDHQSEPLKGAGRSINPVGAPGAPRIPKSLTRKSNPPLRISPPLGPGSPGPTHRGSHGVASGAGISRHALKLQRYEEASAFHTNSILMLTVNHEPTNAMEASEPL